MYKYLNLPLKQIDIINLKAGDSIYLTGKIYTARDAAHKRIYEAIQEGNEIPFNIKDNIIYYLGPTPPRENQIIGSAGPTTSERMDKYTPSLLDNGLIGMIGKGKRSIKVKESIIKNKAIYFVAIGGAGALLSKKITSSKIIAYDDLGTEAIRELYVNKFPVIVAFDMYGNDVYDIAYF